MILATITFTPVMKQNKRRPEWAADRVLVRNDSKRQPYPGNDGKVRRESHGIVG